MVTVLIIACVLSVIWNIYLLYRTYIWRYSGDVLLQFITKIYGRTPNYEELEECYRELKEEKTSRKGV